MKPILFNTDMVRAILDGRKTVTRRVVKPQPICYGPNVTFKPHGNDFFLSAEKNWLRCRSCGHDPEYNLEGSDTSHHWVPPYRPGDILYVRETWGIKPYPDGLNARYVYKADGVECQRWRPSIHMHRKAARIFLRVTNVRVERLQEITEAEAVKEGFEAIPCDHPCGYPCTDCMNSGYLEPAMLGFVETWNSTIKPADRAIYGWKANPWVWVIGFERITKEDALIRDCGCQSVDKSWWDDFFLKNWERREGEFEPRGNYILREDDGRYTSMDNSHGCAWVETFDTLEGCLQWLSGKEEGSYLDG